MQVHQDIEHLPGFNKAILTIGTFDGVHAGHRKIISRLTNEAVRTGGESVIVTFHPHPRKVVKATTAIRLITTIEERIELLESLGVDHLVIVPFTSVFSQLTPEAYVEQFLVSRFHPETVIIGYDHRFGKDRKGDYHLLEHYHDRNFFELQEIPREIINDNTVSSTLIRESLTLGDIVKANELLGYTFFFEGKVIKGDQRGRTIGFPTANLQMVSGEKIVPCNGVYAVDVTTTSSGSAAGPTLKGMMNIGVRPTVDGSTKTIEVHIFDFSEDLYEQTLRVSVKKFLRSEQKFTGIEELKAQLQKDKEAAQ